MREFRVTSRRGLRLAVCEWGRSTDPLVICLHGFLDQALMWEGCGRLLAERGFRVLAYDARGHGLSDHVGLGGYYHFPDYCVDLDAVAELAEESPFTLVGHSMGGTVACLYAGLRPEVVQSLVLIEGLGPMPEDNSRAVNRFRTHLDQMRSLRTEEMAESRKTHADVATAAGRMRRYNSDLTVEFSERLAGRVTEPADDGSVRWRWDRLHMTRSPSAFDAQRFEYLLSQVAAPVWLVSGQKSAFFGIDTSQREQAFEDLREKLILDSGHHPHLSQPEQVAQLIHRAAIGAGDA